MAAKDSFDPDKPWNTPLGGAAKPKTDAEINTAMAKKPAAGPTASEASGEPRREDFSDPIQYNLAMRKWTQKQTSGKRVSGK